MEYKRVYKTDKKKRSYCDFCDGVCLDPVFSLPTTLKTNLEIPLRNARAPQEIGQKHMI